MFHQLIERPPRQVPNDHDAQMAYGVCYCVCMHGAHIPVCFVLHACSHHAWGQSNTVTLPAATESFHFNRSSTRVYLPVEARDAQLILPMDVRQQGVTLQCNCHWQGSIEVFLAQATARTHLHPSNCAANCCSRLLAAQQLLAHVRIVAARAPPARGPASTGYLHPYASAWRIKTPPQQ